MSKFLVVVQCKCGKHIFGTVTEREHFVLCPDCRRYVNAVDVNTLAALKAMPFCQAYVMDIAVKASDVARLVGEIAETAPAPAQVVAFPVPQPKKVGVAA